MSSRLNPGCALRNLFSIACCVFIGSIGFSLSLRLLVSFVVWTSAERPRLSTCIECELSPSCISLDPSFIWEENDSHVCFFEGFPYPSIMQTRLLPSQAQPMHILFLDRPLIPLPSDVFSVSFSISG